MSRVTRTEQLRSRLLGPHFELSPTERLWGWLGPLIAMAVGGFVRFWNLGNPHQLVFDETYYVKEGYSYLLYGYERKTPDSIKSPDKLFTHGNLHVYGSQPDLVVHPPVGKWVIAFGEKIFGIDSSFGWRFGMCVLGTLSILLIGRAALRLFHSPLLATTASILLAFEGLAFVHSRTSVLDGAIMFFALAGFCALLADRDRSRKTLARKVGGLLDDGVPPTDRRLRYGPWLGLRPWRWVAAISLGLCSGVKFTGAVFLVFFVVMSLSWDMAARRTVGIRHWASGSAAFDAVYGGLLSFVLALSAYVFSWIGWFASPRSYDRQWAVTHPSSTFGWVPASLRSLLHYHQEMLSSAESITTPHDYQSNPWSWMLQARPTSYFYEGPTRGQNGCTVAQCSKAINPIGTPTIWWGGTIAIVILLFMWLLNRDWRAASLLCGIAAGWFPWFHYQDRTIFTFYTVAFDPYVVLACVFVLGMAIGPATASRERRQRGTIAAGAFVVVSVAMFAFFYPIYTAQVIPYSAWQLRMWFPSWV